MTAILACGCGSRAEPSQAVPRWDLAGPLAQRPGPIELPARFEDRLAPEPGSYTLRAEAPVPAGWRGRAVTLAFPELLTPAELWVDGRRVAAHRWDAAAGYRPVGPQAWTIPATHTDAASVELELRIAHVWERSAWLDVAPRLTPGDDVDGWTAFVRTFNTWTSALAVGAMLTIACSFLVMFLMDRTRTQHAWSAARTALACSYPLFVLGALRWASPRWESAVLGFGLWLAIVGGVAAIDVQFFGRRLSRIWYLAIAAHIAIAVALADPYVAPGLYGPFVVALAALGFVIVLWRLIQAARRTPPAEGAVPELVGWVIVFTVAGPDWMVWAGNGDPLAGLRLGGLAIFAYALAQFLSISASLVRSVRRAEQLNLALQDGLTTVQAQRDRIEELNAELQRQVAQRSRQLSDALARLAVGNSSQTAPSPGDTIHGRYRVVRQLGAGGTGIVYEVERIADGERLALKLLASARDPRALARFAREAQLASEVASEHVARVVDLDVATDGVMYLVSELVAGGTLRDVRARRGDVTWALDVACQIARGLGAIHAKGIVHRDLKPSNVLLAGDAEGFTVKIADFGIASSASTTGPMTTPAEIPGDLTIAIASGGALDPTIDERSPDLTQTGFVLGTPAYMAPELVYGSDRATPASDVFSLGVVAFELLTGERPFDLPPPQAIARGQTPQAPADLRARVPALAGPAADALSRALSIDPNERPTVDVLERALSEARALLSERPRQQPAID